MLCTLSEGACVDGRRKLLTEYADLLRYEVKRAPDTRPISIYDHQVVDKK